MAEVSETDVILVGSESIRVEELGPVVTLNDLKACFPYDDSLTRFIISGKQINNTFAHIMRIENRDGEGECYQINNKVKAIYDDATQQLVSLSVDGKPVVDDQEYSFTLQGYHFANSKAYLDISNDELTAIKPPKVVSTSAYQVLEEWLRTHPNTIRTIEGRIVYK
jgi:5'-nucleotidase/UDP-sugar diphosphatase